MITPLFFSAVVTQGIVMFLLLDWLRRSREQRAHEFDTQQHFYALRNDVRDLIDLHTATGGGGASGPNRPANASRRPVSARESFLRYVYGGHGEAGIGEDPLAHDFQHIRAHREVTLRCVMLPARGHSPLHQESHVEQRVDALAPQITRQCVDAFDVKVDELGLCIRWEATQHEQQTLRLVFPDATFAAYLVHPGDGRDDQGDDDPLSHVVVELHVDPSAGGGALKGSPAAAAVPPTHLRGQ